MGAVGPALIFMSLLVAEAIVGAVVLAFAAHCFCVIVEGTAAGMDEVPWPRDPYVDWLVRVVQLLWLVIFWLAPVGLTLRYLSRHDALPPIPVTVGLLVGLFWLLFPLSLLSSLSATSRWVIFRPAVLVGLLRIFPATVAFYFVTALLLGAGGAVVSVMLWNDLPLLAPVLGLTAATALFIYGRLVGRLAWLLGQLERADPQERPQEATVSPPPVRPIETVDPWAVPKEAKKRKKKKAAPPASSVEGYGLAPEEPPPATVRSRHEEDFTGDLEPLRVKEDPEEVKQRKVKKQIQAPAILERHEAKLKARPEEPPPPPLPLVSGVCSFPWYATSRKPWLWLTLGLLALGGLVQLQMVYWAQLQ